MRSARWFAAAGPLKLHGQQPWSVRRRERTYRRLWQCGGCSIAQARDQPLTFDEEWLGCVGLTGTVYVVVVEEPSLTLTLLLEQCRPLC